MAYIPGEYNVFGGQQSPNARHYQSQAQPYYGGSQGGGATDFASALSKFSPMGFLPTLGLQAGGSFLSAIGGALGGKSDMENMQEEMFGLNIEDKRRSMTEKRKISNLAMNQFGQDLFDPNQMIAEISSSIFPQFKEMLDAYGTSAGVDSGVVVGEFFKQLAPKLAGIRSELGVQNAQAKRSSDFNSLNIMASLV